MDHLSTLPTVISQRWENQVSLAAASFFLKGSDPLSDTVVRQTLTSSSDSVLYQIGIRRALFSSDTRLCPTVKSKSVCCFHSNCTCPCRTTVHDIGSGPWGEKLNCVLVYSMSYAAARLSFKGASPFKMFCQNVMLFSSLLNTCFV